MTADDYFAIQNLLFQYPYTLDRGDFAGVGALFAKARVYSGGALLADRDSTALARAFRDWVITYSDGTPRTRHLLCNVVIRPAGHERATISSYVLVVQQVPGGPLEPVIGGDYLDTVEKAGGCWGFVERHMGNDLVGDLTRHGRSLETIVPTRANPRSP